MTTPINPEGRRLKGAQRIVVKIGSSLVNDPVNGGARLSWLTDLAADIAKFRARGQSVLLVSSGSVAIGKPFLSNVHKPLRLEEKQAAAAVGQPILMRALTDAFAKFDITLAQGLITLDDTEIRRRWLNARETLATLRDNDILAVVNENDTVATKEMRYGDNDRLSARVAQMVEADVLVLLSDVDGLYTADPRRDPNARHMQRIDAITDEIRAAAGGANAETGVGTGGMSTKVEAAEIAYGAGSATVIARGDVKTPLSDIEAGGRSTWIVPAMTPGTARDVWLRGHLTPSGTIIVDDGAVEALNSGASLLAVGIIDVKGFFERGEAVSINTKSGKEIAKGLTAYNSADLLRIKGQQSGALQSRLGYPPRSAAIHRDDMIVL